MKDKLFDKLSRYFVCHSSQVTTVLFATLLAVLLCSCGPTAEQMTATAVLAQAQTQTAAPTYTPTATATHTPTPTLTATLAPTLTPMPSHTPTLTATHTPTTTGLDAENTFFVETSVDGWSYYYYDDFSIGLPPEWQHFDLSAVDLEKILTDASENISMINDVVSPSYLRSLASAGFKFMAFDTNVASLSAGIPTSVNFLASDLLIDIPLDDYVEISIHQLKSLFGEDTPIYNERIQLGNHEAERIMYECNLEDAFGKSHKVVFNQYIILDNRTQYVLTMGSTKEQYDRNSEILADIAESFTLTQTEGSILKDQGFEGNGLIIFDSQRHGRGNGEIYVMNADGSDQTRLTSNSVDDFQAAWSPDGSQIAFVSDRDGNYEIYLMRSDGSNQVRLTNNSADDCNPAWSPSGEQIAFFSSRDGNFEIYVMNADGSALTRLTNNEVDDYIPKWSPDSKKIVFFSNRGDNFEIYVMDADGSDQTRLTNNSADDFQAAWSPDGSQIAFVSDRDGNLEIYLMRSDGSNQTRLTNNPASDRSLAWSPDGTWIVFVSERDGNDEIYIMRSDGTEQTRLTNDPADDLFPDW